MRGSISGFGPHSLCTWDNGAARTTSRARIEHHAQAVHWIFTRLDQTLAAHWETQLIGVGHRVVHGGDLFAAPVRITEAVLTDLAPLSDLAPLHNPAAVEIMRACQTRLGLLVPMIAVFDTAFFHDLPDAARHYAVPRDWYDRHGVRRYGFHGIAHRSMHRRCLEMQRGARRVITLQLGQGCSIAALHDGKPLDTSMGFTPLEGLIMATRPGDLDVGVLLYLAARGVDLAQLNEDLNYRSGLLGLSGVSADMRELLTLEKQGHAGARRAVDAFCQRARKYLGAYLALLNGADAIVFGGGIGEHAHAVRARICAGMDWCGIALDEHANQTADGTPARVSASASRIAVYVIPVDEEALIARDAHLCLARDH